MSISPPRFSKNRRMRSRLPNHWHRLVWSKGFFPGHGCVDTMASILTTPWTIN